jgi:hypothetical protein
MDTLFFKVALLSTECIVDFTFQREYDKVVRCKEYFTFGKSLLLNYLILKL